MHLTHLFVSLSLPYLPLRNFIWAVILWGAALHRQTSIYAKQCNEDTITFSHNALYCYGYMAHLLHSSALMGKNDILFIHVPRIFLALAVLTLIFFLSLTMSVVMHQNNQASSF